MSKPTIPAVGEGVPEGGKPLTLTKMTREEYEAVLRGNRYKDQLVKLFFDETEEDEKKDE